MIELFGKQFISEKEASERYGYSTYWFQRQRWLRVPEPKFIRINKNRIFYPVDDTDQFFKKKFGISQ